MLVFSELVAVKTEPEENDGDVEDEDEDDASDDMAPSQRSASGGGLSDAGPGGDPRSDPRSDPHSDPHSDLRSDDASDAADAADSSAKDADSSTKSKEKNYWWNDSDDGEKEQPSLPVKVEIDEGSGPESIAAAIIKGEKRKRGRPKGSKTINRSVKAAKYTCKVCGKDLKFKSHLARHSKIHTEEKKKRKKDKKKRKKSLYADTSSDDREELDKDSFFDAVSEEDERNALDPMQELKEQVKEEVKEEEDEDLEEEEDEDTDLLDSSANVEGDADKTNKERKKPGRKKKSEKEEEMEYDSNGEPKKKKQRRERKKPKEPCICGVCGNDLR